MFVGVFSVELMTDVSGGLCSDGLVLDWVSFTLHAGSTSQLLKVVEILFGSKIVELDKGMYGYDHSGIILGCGRVAWSSVREDMGVHVSLPSKALGLLRDVYSSIVELFDCLRGFGATFTRLDFALDDFQGLISIDNVVDHVVSGQYVSRFKEVRRDMSLTSGGDCLYFGSRSSDSFLRIYDKRAEQIKKGVPESELPKHWVRVELEFKGQNSDSVASSIIENGVGIVPGLFRNYVDFKVRGQDSHKSRWVPAYWWVEFLKFAERCKLSLPKVQQTVEGIKRWLVRQVAPSLHFLVELEGGSVDYLYGLLDSGRGRLNAFHLAMLGCT
mgnify:CR=1 FL=1